MASSTGPKVNHSGLTGAFDPGNKHSYPGSGNLIANLVDRSSTTTDGAFGNSPIFNSSTGTISFGGTRSTYIEHKSSNNVGSFDFNGYSAGYSVSIWVKRTAYGTWKSGGTTNYDGIWNYYWNHNLHFSGNHTGVNEIRGTGFTGYTISMNEWNHIVTTHDNTLSSNNHKIYVNGELHQTSNQNHPTLSSGNVRRFFVGNWDSSWAMVGEIGAYFIFNRPITAFEAEQLYNSHKNRYE